MEMRDILLRELPAIREKWNGSVLLLCLLGKIGGF
jgi:hypothetical protein